MLITLDEGKPGGVCSTGNHDSRMHTMPLESPFRQTSSLHGSAPAKINLTLDVLGPRGDGYHELRSLVISVGLADRICCTLDREPGVHLHCTDAALRGPDNLAVRAARLLAERCAIVPAIRIDLEKCIPVGGGLGGGSSDAATVLRLCNDLWQAERSASELLAMGATLGSDVSFFFALPSAVLTGRGDRVEPAALRWSGWVLLVFAGPAVSTAKVFRAWRPADSAQFPSAADAQVRSASTAAELSPLLSNHLEPAVFRVSPHVHSVFSELNRTGAGPFRVSGAGSTLFRLLDDKDAAYDLMKWIGTLGLDLRASVVAAPAEPDSINV